MMMTRSISALEGNGVGLGVKVGSGVKVAAMVEGSVAVKVGSSVGREGARVGVSLGSSMAVGEGTGGRELPQMLGRLPQPDRIKASRMMERRFRGKFSKDCVC